MVKSATTFKVLPCHRISGTCVIPGDKSLSHRALILAALAGGTSTIHGFLPGADNLSTLHALRQLGVKISGEDYTHQVTVQGVGIHGLQAPATPLDCGNSGTMMRLFAGLLAGQEFSSTLIGDLSLTKRPMARIVKPLSSMGAQITTSARQTAPLIIEGGHALTAIKYTLPVASAQVKSAILLASLYAQGVTTIVEPGLSRDHTERMLQAFGADIEYGAHKIKLQPGPMLSAQHIDIPADISSAAFFIVAATLIPGSVVSFPGVGVNPTRCGVITILKKMGADIRLHNERLLNGEPVADIEVHAAALHGISIPAELVPLAIDEFPILFIAAACAKGKTRLTAAAELRVKETDRLSAMAEGLAALGIDVEVANDGMIIEGGQITGGRVNSFGDHRIAMAFAIAGCVASAPIIIDDCDNVKTSFPNFCHLANQLGMAIDTQAEEGFLE